MAVNPDKLREFEEWLRTPNGYHVWQAFMGIAVVSKRRGKRHNARIIAEMVRERTDIPLDKDKRKINNNLIPLLARHAMLHVKELEGYFELRDCKL